MFTVARKLKGWTVRLFVFLAATALVYLAGRKAGYATSNTKIQKQSLQILEKQARKRETAREAVADIRNADRDDLAQCLRDNDGRW